MDILYYSLGMLTGAILGGLFVAIWFTNPDNQTDIDAEYEDGADWVYCTGNVDEVWHKLAGVHDDEQLDVVFTDEPDVHCIMAARCLRNDYLVREEIYKWRIHKYDI